MKVLITGANGYLGQGIVKAVLDKGYSVATVDYRDNYIDDRTEKYCCNFFEIDKPYGHFGKPDVLLHLAWRDGFVHYSDAHIDDLSKHYRFIRVIGGMNGKRALMIFNELPEYRGKYNRCLWARGYYCETVTNVNKVIIKKYIEEFRP